MQKSKTLWQVLKDVRGNRRACVVTEPMWAIPNQLVLPYVSLYMAAIGLSDAQIGLVASLGLVSELFWGLFSGAVTDKLGRRKSMLVFGLLAWVIPCILWAAAQGFIYFAVAILINGMWRVTGNSFTCMILEEGEQDQLVSLFAIFNLIGLIAGFIAPVAGMCIDRFTLVPAMRFIYVLSMLLMGGKFIIQFRLTHESTIGQERVIHCKNKSLFTLTFEGWKAFVAALKRKRLLLGIILMSLLTCYNIVLSTFWPLYVSQTYEISDALMSAFPFVKSLIALGAYLFLVPKIRLSSPRIPLLAAFVTQIMGLIMLTAMSTWTGMLWAVFVSAGCEALAAALIGPLSESIMAVSIPGRERAQINGLIYGLIILLSIPAGGLAGFLSQMNRMFPLVFCILLIVAESIVAVYLVAHINRAKQ